MATDAAPTDNARADNAPTVQELLSRDTRPVPAPLLDDEWHDQGTADVPRSRYTSPAFAELENEYLWTRTWQFGCMEVDIAEPGDYAVYDVADQSLLISRQADGSIKAYHNSCLHRGTKLRVEGGKANQFKCPFHGWTWSNEGTLVDLPAEWDFPQIWGDPSSCLPEAKVATWAGFVFVNMNPDAEPFDTYAGKLVEHFGEAFDFDQRFRAMHTVKEVPANWKVCMEAFSEGYHVIATHPQILDFCADSNSQYSLWADSPHVTRFHNAFGVQSPHLGGIDEQRVADSYHAFRPERAGQAQAIVPEGGSARAVTAENFRAHLSGVFKRDLADYSDAEVLDAILYHLFPAFAPWAGVSQTLIYRWRPGATPDTCFMDVIRLQLRPDEGPMPEPGEIVELALEQDWDESPGMGSLAAVFEQDMANLPKVQQGLKSKGKKGVSFARYQEGRLRHLHRLIDRYIDEGLAADGRDTAELDPYRVPSA